MPDLVPLPKSIAGIFVPQDETSSRAWSWAQRNVPDFLLTHSVRAYCWGAAIAAGEGWSFNAPILWTAALFHDFGLTRLPRNKRCFEIEGAEVARRFAVRNGMSADEATRVASAIVMHMKPMATLDNGVEIRASGPRNRPRRPRRWLCPCRYRASGSHGGAPEASVRPPLPCCNHARGSDPAGLPERPPAQREGPGRLDGAVSMAICAMTWDGAGAHAAAPP